MMTLEPTKTSNNYVMCHKLFINTGQSYITIYFQDICFGHKTIYKLNIVNNNLKLNIKYNWSMDKRHIIWSLNNFCRRATLKSIYGGFFGAIPLSAEFITVLALFNDDCVLWLR